MICVAKNFQIMNYSKQKKYKETIQFITYWKENGRILCNNMLKESSDLIDIDKNIDDQIDNIILNCLEDTNEGKLKLLLEELTTKNIKIADNIIQKYKNEIKEEFPTLTFY